MRRRSHLAVLLVALLTVAGSIVITTHRELALAADPLAQARAQKAAIERQLADQRAKLAQLKQTSAQLSDQLHLAKAELAQVTAEYQRVQGLLEQVRVQVVEITARLGELRTQISALDDELRAVALDIAKQNDALQARETLLEEHIRSAYERTQISLLEVILSSESLDTATSQIGYLLTVSEQDKALAEEIRVIREQLVIQEETLREGRAALGEARKAASAEERLLEDRKAELEELERRTAELQAAAEQRRAEQEAALNAALEAQGDVAAQVAANERAFAAANSLVNKLVAEQAALEEARRRAAEEARPGQSARGFAWPEAYPNITQEWGPTSFWMEPPYTYHGIYYPHFHGGIDMASGCGTPIMAAGTGVVVASGRPLWPWDPGYGVVIDHGGGVQTWYWHITTNIVVHAGQPVTVGQLIGYEGSTGFSTGCHLHFAFNDHGVWENPRYFLP